MPLVPAVKTRSPALDTCPNPIVLTGIADPRITSIRANAAVRSPPGLVISKFNNEGLSSAKFASKIHSTACFATFKLISSIRGKNECDKLSLVFNSRFNFCIMLVGILLSMFIKNV